MKNRFFILLILLVLCYKIPALEREWIRTLGDTGDDFGFCIKQTSDGGYIIVGTTTSYGNGYQMLLLKTDSLGNELWHNSFGGIGWDEARDVFQTPDGCYIIAGWGDYPRPLGDWQAVLTKTDATGHIIWQRNYGGLGLEQANSVLPTLDGGYILAGWSDSFGSFLDVYVVKTDSLGNEQWHQTYGGTGDDRGWSMQPTSDGGYIIGGNNWIDYSYQQQAYLIKLDSAGNCEWENTYGGIDYYEWCYYTQQTIDGGYIITGHVQPPIIISFDVLLIKTDMYGNELWYRQYGFPDITEEARWLLQTPNNGFMMVGGSTSFTSNEQVLCLITDSLGVVEQSIITGFPQNDEFIRCVQPTSDGNYIFVGYTNSIGAGGVDVLLVKAGGVTNIESLFAKNFIYEHSEIDHKVTLSVQPNPFNSSTQIVYELFYAVEVNLTVYNMLGKEVINLADGYQEQGLHKATFDAENLSNGLYFICLTNGSQRKIQKILLLK